MKNSFFNTLPELVEQARQAAWDAEGQIDQDPLFVCYPDQVEKLEKLLETAKEQWDKYAGDVKPDHLALAAPEFEVLARLDKSSGQVKLVLGLLQNICDNDDLRMDTVVRVINEELTKRGQNT